MSSYPRIKPPPGQARWNPEAPGAGNCVGYWAMNEGGGDRVYDYSPYGNHGTLVNGATWVAGESGPALDLDGTNNYVTTSLPLNTSGPISVVFRQYVATADVGKTSALGGWLTGRLDRINAHAPWEDKTLYWDYGDPSGSGRIDTDYTAYLDMWTDVALVSAGVGGSYKGIYLNGKLAAEDTGASAGPTGNITIDIGRFNDTIPSYSHSKLEYIGFYSSVLSVDEVGQLVDEPHRSIWRPRRGFVFDVGAAAVVPPLRVRDLARLGLGVTALERTGIRTRDLDRSGLDATID